VTAWTAAHQASLSYIISRSLPKLMFIESAMPSNLCHPLPLPSIFPSIRIFSNESALCIRWPKYWSFSFSISPSNEYSGLISIRMDWFDLLAVQGTFKSLLQHHSLKDYFWGQILYYLKNVSRLPWWSSGQNSVFSMQGAWVPSPIGEIRFCMPCGTPEKNIKEKKNFFLMYPTDILWDRMKTSLFWF